MELALDWLFGLMIFLTALAVGVYYVRSWLLLPPPEIVAPQLAEARHYHLRYPVRVLVSIQGQKILVRSVSKMSVAVYVVAIYDSETGAYEIIRGTTPLEATLPSGTFLVVVISGSYVCGYPLDEAKLLELLQRTETNEIYVCRRGMYFRDPGLTPYLHVYVSGSQVVLAPNPQADAEELEVRGLTPLVRSLVVVNGTVMEAVVYG